MALTCATGSSLVPVSTDKLTRTILSGKFCISFSGQRGTAFKLSTIRRWSLNSGALAAFGILYLATEPLYAI
jgi:hypothetical protein